MANSDYSSALKLRLVVWNCADGFARKARVIQALQPDLAIIAECRYTALMEIESGFDPSRICWIGQANKRGLAIIGREEWRLEAVSLELGDQWFLPVIARHQSLELRLLGVWVKPAEDYLAPTLRSLDRCSSFLSLSNGPAIVADDFNHNVMLDRATAKRRFSDIVTRLASLNLVSAWYTFHKEAHGQESVPTFYFQRRADKTYHIDYTFLPNEQSCKLARVELGSYSQRVETGWSDHVPLMVESVISVSSNAIPRPGTSISLQ